MKKIISSLIVVCLLQHGLLAQLTTLPDGGNKMAMVGERIGLTDVTIHYNRPGIKNREGKIWGALVPFGFTDLGFGTSTAAPWRAGANENTTIEFSTDVTVDGKLLTAGKYGFFIAVGKENSTLIFSKNNSSWGSYFYDEKEDALRINIQQQPLDKSVERLQYEFANQTANTATIELQWEKLQFAFKVSVDIDKSQLESFRKELKTDKGFDWKPWAQAADYCATNNINLEEGLQWADYSISGKYIGEKNFKTLNTKASLLKKLNREAEATAIMQEAIPFGNMNELHSYARQLLASKKTTEAAAVFKTNYKKYPNVFTTNMGMTRALSSEANYKEALKYATAALVQAPDAADKKIAEGMIAQLKMGKDVNQ